MLLCFSPKTVRLLNVGGVKNGSGI